LKAALAALAALACLWASESAEAYGRPALARGEAIAARAGAGDILAEARRWIGYGNPTPFREPWCRDFVNMVIERAGYRLADRSHVAIAALGLGAWVSEPRPGDLAVMAGHVTFFAGWDGASAFVGLGGNQHHRVTLARFARRAVVAFVRVG